MRESNHDTRAAMRLSALIFSVSLSLAAIADERLKAPAAAEPQSAKKGLEAHFATYEKKRAQSSTALIRDRAARQSWSDLEYTIIRAINEGRPLGDLSEFGLVSGADGSFSVDPKRFPQWMPLDARLPVLASPVAITAYEAQLEDRGFRQSDINQMRTYIAEHDLAVAIQASARPIAEKYEKHFSNENAAGRALNVDNVIDYHYEIRRSRRETELNWSLGLLDVLDSQRQRILASFFDEVVLTKWIGKAQQNERQMLEAEAKAFASGEYVSSGVQSGAQIQREAENRRLQILEGLKK